MADLQVDWDGRHYTLDLDSVTGGEFADIETLTGQKPGAFLSSLFQPVTDAEGNTTGVEMPSGAAVNCLAWLFKKRDGQPVRLSQVDVPYASFLKALMEGITAAQEEAPKVPPATDPATESNGSETVTPSVSDGESGV